MFPQNDLQAWQNSIKITELLKKLSAVEKLQN